MNIKTAMVCPVALAMMAGSAFAGMQVQSNDFKAGGALAQAQVLEGFGCHGGNLSPHLSWRGAPEGTKSFVVMAYDPDAPTGSGWWHWTVFDIPVSVTELPAGAGSGQGGLPEGAKQGRTDFGTSGYGGACPPEGDKPHRYEFTVYALPTESLPLDETAPGAMVGFFAHGQALDQATVSARYGR
jgi:Raf kinase inhibitor-like YbhB/YbcL family protein